ncbi:MAG TPA: hypothetical protein VH352_15335, partial [Pseudonocardiaceae bacterium]|nr:hypothetical protein [Pseudonocardiaceae bacterium]
PTFNQLLGINNRGLIAGYFGSGAAGHPNKGYVVPVGARAFRNENVPHSVQTQVTGLNDWGVTVGFSSPANNMNQVNANVGFVAVHGRFRSVAFPATDNATPPVNQLLGINNYGTAVGFYNDANGNSHGYRYDTDHNRFHRITVPNATSATATAINNDNDVAGFFTNAAGGTNGFLLLDNGHTSVLAFPGAAMTQALGVNDHREVVGVYTVGTGNNAMTHGFVWTAANGFRTVDDPAGVGATTVNGVNNAGQLVGFYADAAGNTHGMLATPHKTPSTTSHLTLRATPVGTVSLTRAANGNLAAHLNLFGLTPGSRHDTAISRGLSTVVRFPEITADGAGRVQATITSIDKARELPAGSQFTIRLGTSGSPLAAQVIARSGALTANTESQFHAVSENSNHVAIGQLSGRVTAVFDATAQKLTLTVNATGLSPGAHAAHIHIGTCANQGAVQYMIMDLQANAHGDVVNETRVVTGVTAMPPAGTRYLNIHQGDSNSILANGSPALPFRPLLCANF